MLTDYMHRWDARTRTPVSTDQWIPGNETPGDKEGELVP
jgi:hypothetical protein